MQLNDPKLSLAHTPPRIIAAISPRAPSPAPPHPLIMATRTPRTPCN